MDYSTKKIVFYDGDCGFCNRSVSFVLKNDATKSIEFAPIQSEFTTQLFKANNWQEPDLSTFYFFENGVLYTKSKAALRVSKYFKWPTKLLRIIGIIPNFLRDWVYDFIAARRKKISNGFCVMPSPEERKRFLH